MELESGIRRSDGTSNSSSIESLGLSNSTFSYNGNFIRSASAVFMMGEIVFGLLVWTLIGGTEYLNAPALGWVMFVSVFYWVLTIILFLLYLTISQTRIHLVPWKMLGVCFNASASVLYLTAAVISAVALNSANRERYYFISWVASTIFASLAMLCYAGNTVVILKSWKSKSEDISC
ncbi:CKLF-like MARVEL transmembrane domain-containing protein 8b isoform X1 [Misgurnus anguillicaudatus]|uniref:CKLF-like MARVEL transmembrane domain-containing protein 8b isoform X1 n=1 Tax=Misgurnus anguillicaudatus TaxID=75329 RepID=UPI0024355190|nr:CKLF-like MARVEL transmembrane domain-containing protein 8b isoform X1 [Misgurnus anguillicaudatus]